MIRTNRAVSVVEDLIETIGNMIEEPQDKKKKFVDFNYFKIDLEIYIDILSKIIEYLDIISFDKRDFFITAYLNALIDFRLIDVEMYEYCINKIMEDIKNYD